MRSLASIVRPVIRASWSEPPFWSLPQLISTISGDREKIPNSFDGYVEGAFKSSGVIFTCILVRQFVLSEARFQFQRLEGGRPGDLFGTPALEILERPWLGGTTGELIGRMEQDSSLAGNFYATVADGRLRRLRPDWVTIVTGSRSGSPHALDAQVIAYQYQPPGEDITLLTPAQVVHYSPIPDPSAQWRGMSWVTAIVREVEADKAATKHKLRFFENGATTNLVITYDPQLDETDIRAHAEFFAEQYQGVDKAYKTIHLGGGADPKMVGANMQQMDFKVTQGAGESRVAAASLVGAVVAQFSEGMAGSALNMGNFKSALDRFVNLGARPLWRSMAASLETVVEIPDGPVRLWYDDRDIPLLREDSKKEAEIRQIQAQTISRLSEAGADWDAAVRAVISGDLASLEGQHSGLFSVQLQPANPDDGQDDD